MPNSEVESAKDLLIKMYLELKIRKKEELDKINNDKINEEMNSLKRLSFAELINYITNTINILIEMKANLKYDKRIQEQFYEENADEECSKRNDKKSLAKQYEELLIKAENDIRKHIKVRK